MRKTAITPTREENFADWYQEVVKQARLAETSSVRGCMVICPEGYALWEGMQQILDKEIKKRGHRNAYFPLFIPLSHLQKEAEHVDGFAKECAVVTHHRLELKDGKLIPAGPLEEPLVVRPTSETIIGESFSRWVQSYRDLPLLINQWANVVRWEMRPRLLLRTAEFLWQEGHTAHASEEEAREETLKMLDMYFDFFENVLAIPAVKGEKSPGERFPGAENTYCLELMMQDGKALQACTSHYLGQKFAKASEIRFCNREGVEEYAYTTSWGTTTRMIGALVMVHGDDDGLRIPPKIAPRHVVIIPVFPKKGCEEQVLEKAYALKAELESALYEGVPVIAEVDTREISSSEKSWDWIRKGVPLRIEIGPKDIEKGHVVIARRTDDPKHKSFVTLNEVKEHVVSSLKEVQQTLYTEASAYMEGNINKNIHSLEDLKSYFAQETQGFAEVSWCGEKESEDLLSEIGVSIRCIPFNQPKEHGKCALTGKEGRYQVLIAKAY